MPLTPDFYEEYACPECHARQRVYLGDPQDFSLPDVDSVRCRNCGNVERLDPDADPDDGEGYVADGEPPEGE